MRLPLLLTAFLLRGPAAGGDAPDWSDASATLRPPVRVDAQRATAIVDRIHATPVEKLTTAAIRDRPALELPNLPGGTGDRDLEALGSDSRSPREREEQRGAGGERPCCASSA